MTNSRQPQLPRFGDAVFDYRISRPDALQLSSGWLEMLAHKFRDDGVTRDQLGRFAQEFEAQQGFLARDLGYMTDRIKGEEGSHLSFNRGAMLAYRLIQVASRSGLPVLGLRGYNAMTEYQNRSGGLIQLWNEADGLLTAQTPLNEAYTTASHGLPEGTEEGLARFGAGTVALGILAAKYFDAPAVTAG